jgi:hypothetical protein
MHDAIRNLIDDIGVPIAEAVETVVARAADRQGVTRPPKKLRPVVVTPVIETRTASDGAPPGMVEIMAWEIFRLAGVEVHAEFRDAVAYVYQRPRTPEQAREMLANMAITAGR